ncbi:LLM class oxidoreductase [Mycobacterium kiyosense]|nr:hypothetical protein IWGMT90018_28910 [Mycobacterium kiyosense]
MTTTVPQGRQLHLAGFFSAGNVTHAHGAWRHVGATNGFLSGEYYKRIARTLERGKFDLLFLPDGLAIEDSYGGDLQTGVGLGGQGAIALEPTSVVATMAAATDRLGLGATVSTTHDVLPALPRRADLRDAGPSVGWPGVLECGDVA